MELHVSRLTMVLLLLVLPVASMIRESGLKANSSAASLKQRQKRDGAAIATAVGTVIGLGPSVANTLHTLSKDDYMVTAIIEVENWTIFPLTDPVKRIKNGVVRTNPTDIMSGKMEAFAVRKGSLLPKGTQGLVAWKVNNRRFVLMWKVPFVYVGKRENVLGLGMSTSGVTTVPKGNEWYDALSGGFQGDLDCKTKGFTSDHDNLIFKDTDFLIRGTMTNGRFPKINVKFMASRQNWNNNIKKN